MSIVLQLQMKKMHVYVPKGGVYMHLHGTAFLFRDTFIIIYYIEKVQYWNSMDKHLESLIDMLYW